MATDKEKNIDPLIIREMFSYCPETGLLIWRGAPRKKGYKKTMAEGEPAFTTRERKGYMNGRVSGYLIKAHRAVWAWHTGRWPIDQIDHINGIPWDNRIENLRECVNQKNCSNQSKPRSNTSGWIGVSQNKRTGGWVAKFRKNYVDYHVGVFGCPTAAAIAVMKARKKHGFSEIHGRRSPLMHRVRVS